MKALLFILALLIATPGQAATFNPDFSTFPHWAYVLEHEHFSPPNHPFTGNLKHALDKLHAHYRRVPYQTDVQTYGEVNHWATRAETWQHGAADCKGIAVAELYDLLEMGIPDRDVTILTVTVRQTGELHAIVVLRGWVLDSRSPTVLRSDQIDDYYTPIFYINRIGWGYATRQGINGNAISLRQ